MAPLIENNEIPKNRRMRELPQNRRMIEIPLRQLQIGRCRAAALGILSGIEIHSAGFIVWLINLVISCLFIYLKNPLEIKRSIIFLAGDVLCSIVLTILFVIGWITAFVFVIATDGFSLLFAFAFTYIIQLIAQDPLYHKLIAYVGTILAVSILTTLYFIILRIITLNRDCEHNLAYSLFRFPLPILLNLGITVLFTLNL